MLTNRLSGTTEDSVSDRDGPRNSGAGPFAPQRSNRSQHLRSSRRAPKWLYIADQGIRRMGADRGPLRAVVLFSKFVTGYVLPRLTTGLSRASRW
jgi:hypothetical protein